MEKIENKSHEFALIDAIEAIDNYFGKQFEWDIWNPTPSSPSPSTPTVPSPSYSPPSGGRFGNSGIGPGSGISDIGAGTDASTSTPSSPPSAPINPGSGWAGGEDDFDAPTLSPVDQAAGVAAALEPPSTPNVPSDPRDFTTPSIGIVTTPDPAPPPSGTDVGIGEIGAGTDRVTGNVGTGVTIGAGTGIGEIGAGTDAATGNIISAPDPDPDPDIYYPDPDPIVPVPDPSPPVPDPSPPVAPIVAPPPELTEADYASPDSETSSEAAAACSD